jgi:nitrate reductase delta subunit
MMIHASASVLERLAALVEYPVSEPDEQLLDCLEDPALDPEAGAELERFAAVAVELTVSELQEEYTATFDFTQACSLDLGWHLFGDTHERGAFMAALLDDMGRAGVPENAEMPDHLTHVLTLLARDPERAPALAEVVAPAVDSIARALAERASPYAHLIGAISAEVNALRVKRHEEVSHS